MWLTVPLHHVGARIAGRLVSLALVGLILGLNPMAYASPPDETWIGGYYDDADYDDVVLAITASMGVVDPPRRLELLAGGIVGGISLADERFHAVLTASYSHTRAPPSTCD